MKSDTTTAGMRQERPSDQAVATAMRDLEDDICALCSMAAILGDLLDHDLTECLNGERRAMPEPGGHMKVFLGYQQMEMLSFAWNDVIRRSERLKRRWNDAIDGKAVQS